MAKGLGSGVSLLRDGDLGRDGSRDLPLESFQLSCGDCDVPHSRGVRSAILFPCRGRCVPSLRRQLRWVAHGLAEASKRPRVSYTEMSRVLAVVPTRRVPHALRDRRPGPKYLRGNPLRQSIDGPAATFLPIGFKLPHPVTSRGELRVTHGNGALDPRQLQPQRQLWRRTAVKNDGMIETRTRRDDGTGVRYHSSW